MERPTHYLPNSTWANYGEFLQSQEWRELSSFVSRRDKNLCQRCGLGPYSGKRIDIHLRRTRFFVPLNGLHL